MAGQTMTDRLLAARHSIAGQGLAKSVCKATTEELIGPKKKHLDCKYIFNVYNNIQINVYPVMFFNGTCSDYFLSDYNLIFQVIDLLLELNILTDHQYIVE